MTKMVKKTSVELKDRGITPNKVETPPTNTDAPMEHSVSITFASRDVSLDSK
eukprot:CAMPEP_0195326892 /NCGR_PEP_ID=MMETSP0708-20121125/9952_1 /TAXON_ID=33640 /ORGANISM="Asterionellopsis glacialis, Strain CCMP134" /LENGTH=51 /DNA_ID=CAMNT_0040394545 /DNA_START=262 /DNA_END=417 /DNA_ORIENTATION=+